MIQQYSGTINVILEGGKWSKDDSSKEKWLRKIRREENWLSGKLVERKICRAENWLSGKSVGRKIG